MPAPKQPNTAAASAAKRRRGDETAFARLREHGWLSLPPELVAELPPEVVARAASCPCCSCCAPQCDACAHGSRREILAVPHIGDNHTRAHNILLRPDLRQPESWCNEGVAHTHDACGSLRDSSDPADRARATRDADAPTHAELREWLVAEYQCAATAAERARHARRPDCDGNPQALEHASAVARMCALGETLKRLDAGGAERTDPPPQPPHQLT